MRTLKFRAWSHRDRCWCGAFSIHKSGLFTENPNNDWVDLSEQEDIVLMQYTGLKDKNNKEIYEGDIVRILYTDWISKSSNDDRSLEQYLKDIAEIKVVIWSYNGFYVSHCVNNHYAESMEYGRHGYIEVIGNIYENPELLKT